MSEAKERITDAELEVMQVLWKAKAPMTQAQIKAALCSCGAGKAGSLLLPSPGRTGRTAVLPHEKAD